MTSDSSLRSTRRIAFLNESTDIPEAEISERGELVPDALARARSCSRFFLPVSPVERNLRSPRVQQESSNADNQPQKLQTHINTIIIGSIIGKRSKISFGQLGNLFAHIVEGEAIAKHGRQCSHRWQQPPPPWSGLCPLLNESGVVQVYLKTALLPIDKVIDRIDSRSRIRDGVVVDPIVSLRGRMIYPLAKM